MNVEEAEQLQQQLNEQAAEIHAKAALVQAQLKRMKELEQYLPYNVQQKKIGSAQKSPAMHRREGSSHQKIAQNFMQPTSTSELKIQVKPHDMN